MLVKCASPSLELPTATREEKTLLLLLFYPSTLVSTPVSFLELAHKIKQGLQHPIPKKRKAYEALAWTRESENGEFTLLSDH